MQMSAESKSKPNHWSHSWHWWEQGTRKSREAYRGSTQIGADQQAPTSGDWRRNSGNVRAAKTKCFTHKASRRSNPAAEVRTMTRYVGWKQWLQLAISSRTRSEPEVQSGEQSVILSPGFKVNAEEAWWGWWCMAENTSLPDTIPRPRSFSACF